MKEPLVGHYCLRSLGDILADMRARRIFVVASPSILKDDYARPILDAVLNDRVSTIYSNYGKGPELRDVLIGTAQLKAFNPDLILSIGGGTPLDFAKLINVYATNVDPFVAISARLCPLVAIPTTCGTGSEATPFAVIYKDKIKHSLESSEYMLPELSILDPELLRNLPALQIACTGLDATCQSVESWWSVKSTEASRSYSRVALKLIHQHFLPAWRNRNPESLSGMLLAAHNSGKAIAIAKTTASHALSYPLTAFFGVPHGHAVALTLAEVLVHNAEIATETCWDSRGVEYVKQTLGGIIEALGAKDVHDAYKIIKGYMHEMNLETTLKPLGVKGEKEIEFLMSSGINPQRLKNNPRALDEKSIKSILTSIL
jgi:alcohol dehydrogenase